MGNKPTKEEAKDDPKKERPTLSVTTKIGFSTEDKVCYDVGLNDSHLDIWALCCCFIFGCFPCTPPREGPSSGSTYRVPRNRHAL